MDFQSTIYNAGFKKLTALSFTNADLLARCMVAQAEHETGGFTSDVFKTNNNAFGYKRYAGSSYQIGAGKTSPEGDSYANYRSVADSATEIAAWIGRRKTQFVKVSTVDTYVSVLKANGYFGDSLSNYLAGVKKYFSSLPTAFKVASGFLPLAVIGLLIYKFLL